MRDIRIIQHIPIIVLSNSREQSDLVRAYQLQANSYVRKSVEFRQFMHVFCSI